MSSPAGRASCNHPPDNATRGAGSIPTEVQFDVLGVSPVSAQSPLAPAVTKLWNSPNPFYMQDFTINGVRLLGFHDCLGLTLCRVSRLSLGRLSAFGSCDERVSVRQGRSPASCLSGSGKPSLRGCAGGLRRSPSAASSWTPTRSSPRTRPRPTSTTPAGTSRMCAASRPPAHGLVLGDKMDLNQPLLHQGHAVHYRPPITRLAAEQSSCLVSRQPTLPPHQPFA